MKVDFWLGMAAKRASLPTITLASIRKANFDFVETATFVVCVNKFLHTRSLAAFIFQFSIFNSRSFVCLARAKIKIIYSAKMGAKWTIPHQRYMLFGNQSLLMRKISLSVFRNERLWQNYSLCLIRFV